MILSRGRRYIFLHAPKTGGTALTLALEERAMKDDILAGDTPKAVKRRNRLKELSSAGPLTKHAKLADIDGLIKLEELDDFFIFMLVRNPWDRIVSYYHWLRVQDFKHPAVVLSKLMPFHAFVLQPHTQRSFAQDPYSAFVTDAAGRERDAHFVRLEHLAEDLAPVEAHLGLKLGDIPRANASDRDPDYRRYYTDETRAAVADACAEDIARFGYHF